MKKFVFFLLFLFSIMLSGCGEDKLSAENPVTLSIWHVYGSQIKSPLNDQIEEFNNTEGKKQGIVVKVVSVLDSSKIDTILAAAIKKEPGAASLPNMFTAYPRVFHLFEKDQLLDWKQYLTKEELDQYNERYLEEGYVGDRLYMLPIAKSTDLLLVNKTLYDRFAAANGLNETNLNDFDSLFATCQQYYRWTKGKQMFQFNDFYHYFFVNMASFDKEFVTDGTLDTKSETFARLYIPMAKAAIAGGLSTEKGYATDRWKTAELISNIGSTAGVMYNRDYVTYRNNTRENIQLLIKDYPFFVGGKRIFVLRGTGLVVVKNSDERYNKAAAVFAKWLVQKEHNLPFVTATGYVPVHKDALQEIYMHPERAALPKARPIYEILGKNSKENTYRPLPQYPGSDVAQKQFEDTIRAILQQKYAEYQQKVPMGESNAELLDQLVQESLVMLQNEYK